MTSNSRSAEDFGDKITVEKGKKKRDLCDGIVCLNKIYRRESDGKIVFSTL